MTVVQYDQPPPLPASQPGDERETGPTGDVARLRAAAEYAAYIADTEFVPAPLRGRPAAIAAAILYGAELGLNPMRSLAMIAVIKGRPAMIAEAQRAKILAEGHEIWFEESTTTRATAAGRRKSSDRIGRITWTLDDAKRAGLAGNPAYRSYPAEMLRARASAALARAMFADVIGGLAAAEELEGGTDNGPAIETAPDQPPPKATRKRSRPALAPTPPPDPQPEPDPEPPPEPATDAQLRRMFALFRDQDIEDRQSRLAYTEQVLGRKIESSKELSKDDASKVIDALQPNPPVFRIPDGVTLPPDQQAVVDEIKAELDATLEPPLPDEEHP
jgi:hypothetical protein